MPRLPRAISEQKELIASFGDAWLEKEFAVHFELLETGRLDNAFDQASAFAPTITLRNGEAGVVMIDEFQVLTEVYDKRYESFRDVTPWFQKPAEVRWCPMVISGSAVSLVVKTVMGGMLARRFGPYYLEPFSAQHSLEYAYKLANNKNVRLSEPSAAEIHRLTGGNPYYTWCLFNSIGLEDNDLSTSEKVEKLYTFETTDRNGKIRKFWDEHFDEFADKINDEQIGLQCLYQLAVAKEDVRAEDIAAKLNARPEKVRRVLKNLEHSRSVGMVRKGEVVEFDLLAEGDPETSGWLVEVRYRKEPVRVADVEKFVEKLKKIEGWQAPTAAGKRLWFFSRSGFDTEAGKRLKKLGILHCDIHGFNALCRAVKIGEVPV